MCYFEPSDTDCLHFVLDDGRTVTLYFDLHVLANIGGKLFNSTCIGVDLEDKKMQ
jgi:hypothetical protein